ncbi:zgc:172076 [Triplophysa rosa]|uniref:creatine kinase n=1 Tax=Triplophysa rosa TaxID=992332 RepID=A0A9W7WME0_TRIRA|nr:zgc:172076 [Triplophysa rosa]KAI7804198.1 putative creatine kinase [Triplophysa rosa]
MWKREKMWMIKPPTEHPKECKYRPVLESLLPRDPMSRFNLKRSSPKEEFPNLDRNYTLMGGILDLHMYTRQFNRATESGVIFDDVIRPGLEDTGLPNGPKSVGCLAGDAQSYILFCDFFDRIIESYHGYRVTSDAVQESDFNYDNLKGGDYFDEDYVVSCEVSAGRAVDDFCFPVHCSRGERRHLLALAKTVLEQLSEDLPGKFYSIEELSCESEDRRVVMDSPPSSLIKTGVARDWPDGRALWLSKDGSLAIWVNMEEHLKLVSFRSDGNLQEAFKCVCINLMKTEILYKKLRHPFIWKHHLGWVVSSPAEVGTGLKTSVTVKLLHLTENKRLEDILDRLRLRMEETGCPGIYNISNLQTIGFNEVELTQLVVDGVKLLIRMEKRLENNSSIEDLVPTKK